MRLSEFERRAYTQQEIGGGGATCAILLHTQA